MRFGLRDPITGAAIAVVVEPVSGSHSGLTGLRVERGSAAGYHARRLAFAHHSGIRQAEAVCQGFGDVFPSLDYSRSRAGSTCSASATRASDASVRFTSPLSIFCQCRQ